MKLKLIQYMLVFLTLITEIQGYIECIINIHPN